MLHCSWSSNHLCSERCLFAVDEAVCGNASQQHSLSGKILGLCWHPNPGVAYVACTTLSCVFVHTWSSFNHIGRSELMYLCAFCKKIVTFSKASMSVNLDWIIFLKTESNAITFYSAKFLYKSSCKRV